MRIAIVEDEAVVARRLERMVRGFAGDAAAIEVAPSLDAAAEIIKRPLDLLFLDLNLNGRDGFALLEEAAASRFETVVVSAHHDQALRAFDYGVTDFVTKPWSEERLRTAFARATGREHHGRASKLVIRKGRELRTIDVSEVLYIRGADDYSEVHVSDGTVHLHEKSLSALESLLPHDFARVHRSYIANLERVRGVQSNAIVLDDGSVIPVGRASRQAIRERLGIR
jgi:DNA-binding LytR/AlgR family response regulator